MDSTTTVTVNATLCAKRTIVDAYVKQYGSLAKQGTDQWREERKYCVGGSEIHQLISGDVNKFVKKKVAPQTFHGNCATRWGSLFEHVSSKIVTELFVIGQIYELGSVPHKEINGHRYSPDGLCIVVIDGEERITLLEFKSPFITVPTTVVPTHYRPQVYAGMDTIDVAECAIFVNNVYRRCTMEQLGFEPTYDTKLHWKDFSPWGNDIHNKRPDIESALAYGIILFHVDDKNLFEWMHPDGTPPNDSSDEGIQFIPNMDIDIDTDSDAVDTDEDDNYSGYVPTPTLVERIKNRLKGVRTDLIDLGGVSVSDFESFLKMVSDGLVGVKYVMPTINDDIYDCPNMHLSHDIHCWYQEPPNFMQFDYSNVINIYKKRCSKGKRIPIAVLPWKLIVSDNIYVDKVQGYLKPYAHKIEAVASMMKAIYSMDEKNREAHIESL